MKTIIAGSRSITDPDAVREAIARSGIRVTAVVSGTAGGVDTLGEKWAEKNGIPVFRYPADWSTGKGAGFVRNQRMAENAEALIAVWDGGSKGTLHMIGTAHRLGLKVFIHNLKSKSS